jgi:hypothetical protein
MAKLKITKTEASGQMHDRYTMPTQIPAGTYVGGTGGFTAQTGRQIQPKVKVGSATASVGSIIKQKGSHKFQVSDENTVADESVVVGQQYRINSVGSTDWTAMGAGPNANTNEVFVATAVGSGSGTVQNVGECILVNLNTPTADNTMSITCTAANVSNANIANIGANVSGNRVTAYVTWNTGDVVGGTANFEVGQTINLINSNVTGNLTITSINSTSNLTVTTDATQTIPVANTSAFTATFQASKISNKFVWDFLNGGTPGSSATGGFTGANNPNRYRYHLAAPTDTFVQVAYA